MRSPVEWIWIISFDTIFVSIHSDGYLMYHLVFSSRKEELITSFVALVANDNMQPYSACLTKHFTHL